MKVAIFTDTYKPQINGVTKTLDKYVEYMEEEGIEYIVFAPLDKKGEYNDRIKRFFSFKFFLYPECRVSLPNYFSIVKELKQFDPDIIHIVTPFNIGLCGLKYATAYDVPIVSSYHTNIPEYLEYFGMKFLSNLSWEYFCWFHKFCEKNYCPSTSTLELLESKGIKNLEIWDRGINTEKFSPIHRDQAFRYKYNLEDKIVFLYVGRMSPEKDLDIFIEVAKKLNLEYEDKIHFLMVGEGPMLNDLKHQNIANMTFTGFLQGNDLAKAYASSEVFLFPSPSETYGNVILEAMASRLATIACYSQGIKENLYNGYNGIACRVKNADDYYNACERLILDADYRSTLASNGREYTMKKSWNKVFDKLFRSYQEVTATNINDNVDYISA